MYLGRSNYFPNAWELISKKLIKCLKGGVQECVGKSPCGLSFGTITITAQTTPPKQEQQPMTQSPCQRKCRLDENRHHCETCLRTLDEIRRWGSMDRSEREKVEVELVRRTIACGIKGN